MLADGKLVSPGCEETKESVSLDAIEGFLRWLDIAWDIRHFANAEKWRVPVAHCDFIGNLNV